MKKQEQVRIQKYSSDCGVMSRRAAEEAISDGRVTVNGEKALIGQKVTPFKDKVAVDGKIVSKKVGEKHVYVMLNKPTGYVTTLSDDKGRKTVASLVEGVGKRIYPIGRLDMDSEGLLLLTDDGELTNALTHPKHHVAKYYDVKVEGEVTRAKLIELSSEMEIDGYKIAPVECTVLSKGDEYTVIRMTLYEGRNRQIRKMCEKCSLTVKKLRRIAIGDLELDIGKGKWRYLTLDEIDYLRRAAGLEIKRY